MYGWLSRNGNPGVCSTKAGLESRGKKCRAAQGWVLEDEEWQEETFRYPYERGGGENNQQKKKQKQPTDMLHDKTAFQTRGMHTVLLNIPHLLLLN